jgi:phosphoribosylformylglycinamidine cyclo-ligase
MLVLEDRAPMVHTTYKMAGVDTAEADAGLSNIVNRIKATWPRQGMLGEVKLSIGYFANVIDIGGIGLGFCTDGVGSKAIIAEKMKKYDTIGIDCVAMNVNDLICVGAKPLSMVDYIAINHVNARVLDGIAKGLADGANQAGISISGGETAQLPDVVNGFDLAGTAVGLVPLDRIIVGKDLQAGDQVIGIRSNGIHSNGLSLARRTFSESGITLEQVVPELGCTLGEELLRPTHIYVREILEIIDKIRDVKALINITSDGFLNLPRVDAQVGFVLDNLSPSQPIFDLIQERGGIQRSEMFEVFNMGVGFCVIVSKANVEATLEILARHERIASVIGYVADDMPKSVRLPKEGLIGKGKKFHPA